MGCLEKRGFSVSELKLFASARSAGKVKNTPMGDVTIEEFSLESVSPPMSRYKTRAQENRRAFSEVAVLLIAAVLVVLRSSSISSINSSSNSSTTTSTSQ